MINFTQLTDYIGASVNHSYNEAMEIPDTYWKELLHTKKVLLFKNWKNLEPKDVASFSTKLGSLWNKEMYDYTREHSYLDENDNTYTVYSNQSYLRLSQDIPWHVDIANEPNFERYPIRVLYCKNLPSHYEGLSTDVSNLIALYNELSTDEKEQFANSYFTYQSWQYPGTYIKDLSAVCKDPYTNELFLRINVVHPDKGWIRSWYELNDDGTKTVLDNNTLKQIIQQRCHKYMYSHDWEVGDLLIFDNWGTIHKKGKGAIFEDSTGSREFIRVTVNNGYNEVA
jgi:alpha-ketoglutarate-dependent taurine dioxygenase